MVLRCCSLCVVSWLLVGRCMLVIACSLRVVRCMLLVCLLLSSVCRAVCGVWLPVGGCLSVRLSVCVLFAV